MTVLSRMLSAQLSRDLAHLIPVAWHAGQQLGCPRQLAAAASAILSPEQQQQRVPLNPALQLCIRAFSASASRSQQGRLVTAFLEDALSSLSIPHGEFEQLVASELSDAALTAWALTKTASHPAVQEAAAVSQKLQQLLTKLDGAMLWQQQAASSPLGQLLWQVAVGAAGRALAALDYEQLEASMVEYQVVHAARSRDPHNSPKSKAVLQEAVQQMHRMTDMPPLVALGHPAFWQLARAAAADSQALAQDLPLLGYDLASGAAAAEGQLQQLQQLLGLDVSELQRALRSSRGLSDNTFLPHNRRELLAAVADDGKARQLVAQLQLLQALAQALGLSAVQVGSPASACELAQRLTGVQLPQREVEQQLRQQLGDAAPQLLVLVAQLPAAALEQPSLGSLLQLMSSNPELQGLAKALTAWRAEAAAAGYLPVMTTLSQSEVAGLSKPQAEGLARAMMQLEARGRLLLRKAAARQLQLGQLDADDAAALAWKLHSGGQAAAEEMLKLVLAQASSMYAGFLAELESAESALTNMAVGFRLEEVTSRRSSAAPPSPLVMAGIPQHQVSELSKSLPSLASSSRSSGITASPAEVLVRDLAVLLAPGGAAGGASSQAAAQRLQVMAHDLPKVLSGPLLDIIKPHQPGTVRDAVSAQQQQQQLRTFLQVLEAELPRLTAASAGSGAGASSTSWSVSSSEAASGAAAEGLLELLGEQDSADVLAHAAKAGAAAPRRFGDEGDDQPEEQAGLYDMLADIHHDIDVQRYLQMEFDPALELDLVHTPRSWQDSDLFSAPADFLDGMRPLLDRYLTAQGEAQLQDMEWQVYRDAALAEHEQVEVSSSSARRAAGHSPFHNSRADEAYLSQRLEAGIPRDSVLYAAAHKYLKASFKNRSWRFVQRKRMVDRLCEIAGHLAQHPARSHRGSPFSALFQPDGPPAVPRLSRQEPAAGPGKGDDDTYSLPPGFGRPHM